MVFAHDTEHALAGAAALVSTAHGGCDELADRRALAAFLDRWAWTGSRRGDDAELAEVRRLRSRLRRLWEHAAQAGPDAHALPALVEQVNELLREGRALPQLVAHDDWPHHLHATPADAPLARRMAVEAAMALVDVVRLGELDRLRVCPAPGCGAAYVDLSKNRSRRWCSQACANRVNAAASRARRAAST